jgi:hydrogenase large subunit
MKAVQEKLKGFVGTGQLGIFTNGYWGHPAMKLPPEVNLLAVGPLPAGAGVHQRYANKIVAILGGKTPHIQNLAVGGVANPINLDSQSVLNMERSSG